MKILFQNVTPFIFLSAFMGLLVYFEAVTIKIAFITLLVVFVSSCFAALGYHILLGRRKKPNK
jgi:hypothetical protein